MSNSKTRKRAQTSVAAAAQKSARNRKRADAETSETVVDSVTSDTSANVETTAGNVVEQSSESVVETSETSSPESIRETANPDTSADASANVDESSANVEQSSDASSESANVETSEANDAPSLDDITSADDSAAQTAATKAASKKAAKVASAPVVKRSAQQIHRAIVGADDLWTARLLYRSKRRMRLASVDVSQFPSAFQSVSVADDATDEQRASADAQNARAATWDAALLDVITESKYLMSNKTDAIVAFLAEMKYDATSTSTKRSAVAASKKAARATGKKLTPASAQQIGEAQASALIESLGVKRAITQLQKMRAKIDSDTSAVDHAERVAQNDAAQAYALRVQAAKAA